jgi:hypothetical protein
MRIIVRKGKSADSIEIERGDGSVLSTSFPHKGPVPHDVVHFLVELEFGISAGFWGLVAAGRHPEEVGEIAKAAGHASASRARVPEAFIVPAIQAERLVECFEADLWGGGSDPETFSAAFDAACRQSLVPRIAINPGAILRVRHELRRFRDQWSRLSLGGTCSFDWPDELATPLV